MKPELLENLSELTVHEAQLKCRAAHELWQEATAKRKEAELSLKELNYTCECGKALYRPSREQFVDIDFDAERNLWAVSHQGVVAYGDSPEMACDNFDHLWVFGQ